ncbi:MAG: TraB/GumN family protein [SAR86 cluster bacterium]|uniref:TraB/GumN family protein n=1 Tax=SAR86 cluster bacterium TaxID=2030880 RepID=A0A972VXC9_9GAMM|nr:TraB/GumN family protein [SAR86 cluster bacterium]
MAYCLIARVLNHTRVLLVVFMLYLPATAMAELLTLEDIYEKLEVEPTGDMAVELAIHYKKYAKYRKSKALALAFSANGYSIGYSHKASSELGASQLALSSCEKWRVDSGVGGQCEIVLLGDELVSPGAIIKRKVNEATPAMVWRVEGTGGALYLVGTIHALKPTLLPLPAVFDQVFAQSEIIAFEMNPILATDPVRLHAVQTLMAVDPKQQKSLYDKTTRKPLKGFAKNYDLRVASAYTVPAVVNAMQVSQLKMAALGYTVNTGVEMYYAREASKAGKAIVELEGPTDAWAPLVNLPMETQLLMLRETILQLETLPAQLDMLITSWLFGDAEQLYAETIKSMSLSAQTDPDLMAVALEILDKRNQRWMEKIDGMLQAPKSSVVMAGAAHFGGENGLLALLRKQGLNPVQLTWGGDDIIQSSAIGD